MNDRTRVRQNDIDALRAQAREGGIANMALRMFADEPILVEAILRRQRRIGRALREAGVSQAVIDQVASEAHMMLLETTLALDAAHRAMLQGLLPGDETGETDA